MDHDPRAQDIDKQIARAIQARHYSSCTSSLDTDVLADLEESSNGSDSSASVLCN